MSKNKIKMALFRNIELPESGLTIQKVLGRGYNCHETKPWNWKIIGQVWRTDFMNWKQKCDDLLGGNARDGGRASRIEATLLYKLKELGDVFCCTTEEFEELVRSQQLDPLSEHSALVDFYERRHFIEKKNEDLESWRKHLGLCEQNDQGLNASLRIGMYQELLKVAELVDNQEDFEKYDQKILELEALEKEGNLGLVIEVTRELAKIESLRKNNNPRYDEESHLEVIESFINLTDNDQDKMTWLDRCLEIKGGQPDEAYFDTKEKLQKLAWNYLEELEGGEVRVVMLKVAKEGLRGAEKQGLGTARERLSDLKYIKYLNDTISLNGKEEVCKKTVSLFLAELKRNYDLQVRFDFGENKISKALKGNLGNKDSLEKVRNKVLKDEIRQHLQSLEANIESVSSWIKEAEERLVSYKEKVAKKKEGFFSEVKCWEYLEGGNKYNRKSHIEACNDIVNFLDLGDESKLPWIREITRLMGEQKEQRDSKCSLGFLEGQGQGLKGNSSDEGLFGVDAISLIEIVSNTKDYANSLRVLSTVEEFKNSLYSLSTLLGVTEEDMCQLGEVSEEGSVENDVFQAIKEVFSGLEKDDYSYLQGFMSKDSNLNEYQQYLYGFIENEDLSAKEKIEACNHALVINEVSEGPLVSKIFWEQEKEKLEEQQLGNQTLQR